MTKSLASRHYNYLSPLYRIIDDKVDSYILHKFALYHYGRIQEADLYAHFSPVSLINDTKALGDWGGANTPNDSVGTTENVWARLQTIGGKKFYRFEVSAEAESSGENEKRKEEKEYVEGDGKALLIPTALVNSEYINTIIDEHIKNPEPKKLWDRIKEWRYKKPWFIPG